LGPGQYSIKQFYRSFPQPFRHRLHNFFVLPFRFGPFNHTSRAVRAPLKIGSLKSLGPAVCAQIHIQRSYPPAIPMPDGNNNKPLKVASAWRGLHQVRSATFRYASPDVITICWSCMDCAECDRLLAQYERLARAYATAIDTMNIRMGNSPSFEYTQLSTGIDDARINSEIALTELEQHKLVHSRSE
jgi:hypothetical protein